MSAKTRKKSNEVMMPERRFNARIIDGSVDEEARTVRVEYVTETEVFFPSWDEDYFEILSTKKGHVRLDRINSGAAPVLNSHKNWDLENILGVVVEADETHATLRMSDRPELDGLWRDISNGIIKNVSVGYRVFKYEDETPDDNKIRVLRAIDWEPFEISWVAVGADPNAGVRSASQHKCVILGAQNTFDKEKERSMSKKNKENQRADDKNTKTRSEDDVTTADADAPVTENDTPEAEAETKTSEAETPEAEGERSDPVDATRAERVRAESIRTVVRSLDLPEDLADDFVKRGLTLEQTQAEVIKRMANADEQTDTNSTISVGTDNSRANSRAAIENALMHRSSPSKIELTEQGREYRGMSMIEIVRSIIGERETRGMNKREIAERAFHSASDFPEILANIASKTLRQAYGDTKRTFQAFSRQTYLPDFKEAKRVALSNASSLKHIPEGGEYKQGTFTENGETIQLSTYGEKLLITRQMLINDDLDAFTRVPQKLAAAAARLENKMVYDLLTSNPVMADGENLFSAAHKNLTDALLGVDGLAVLRKLFRLQTDPSGNDILNLLPQYLIVPAALEVEAAKLKAQLTPNQTTQVNPLSNSFEIITEGYLDQASSSHFFMAADPSEIDTIEYAYLDGEVGPYIESRNSFDTDGMEIKVRHDFAAKVIDHRGLGKSTNDAS